MTWYRVLLEGKNLETTLNDERCRMGFFTTRLVEAPDRKSAEAAAVSAAQGELGNRILNTADNPVTFEVHEVEASISWWRRLRIPGIRAPGRGFAFYMEDEDDDG